MAPMEQMVDAKARDAWTRKSGYQLNTMRDAYKDLYLANRMDKKKLKANHELYTVYPIDELNIPKWFKELPLIQMVWNKQLLTQKPSNLMSELGWDLESTKTSTSI